jgi:hypothetical protein
MITKAMRAGLLAALLLGVVTPPAGADTFVCNGDLDNVTIHSDVQVAPGGFCRLRNGAVVEGSITAGPDSLLSISGSTVTGSVSAVRSMVQITDSRIGGNVVIDEPIPIPRFQGSSAPVVMSCGNDIGGSLVIRNAPTGGGGPFWIGAIGCAGSTIGGNVVITGNRAGPVGGLSVRGNVITGYLYCAGNDPPPFGGNNVAAQLIGQCASL